MRTMKHVIAMSLLALLPGASGCNRKASNADPADETRVAPVQWQPAGEAAAVLATIGDTRITVGDFEDRLNHQSPYVRARYTSLEQKKDFLDTLIRFEVLAQEAARRGFDKDPEVVRTMKGVMIEKLIRDEFDRKLTPSLISDEELKAYYDANLSEFVKPEEVRAAAIILTSKAQADRVATEAQGEAGKLNKGFRDLVTRYSTDEESKLRGGDLNYLALTGDDASKDVPRAVLDAVFALANTGDVSSAIDAGNGTFYVLKQTGRRHALTKSFEDAKLQIRNKLFREQRTAAQQKFIDDLRAQTKIEIDDASLAKVRVDTGAGSFDDGHGHTQPAPPPVVPGAEPAAGAGGHEPPH